MTEALKPIKYDPTERPSERETQEWTDLMTERVWEHVDLETGDIDLQGYLLHCEADGIHPTVDQALKYLEYASESIREG